MCAFSILTFHTIKILGVDHPEHICPHETAYDAYFYMLALLLIIQSSVMAWKSKKNERVAFGGYVVLCFYNLLDEFVQRATEYKLDEYYYLAAVIIATISIIVYKNRKPL